MQVPYTANWFGSCVMGLYLSALDIAVVNRGRPRRIERCPANVLRLHCTCMEPIRASVMNACLSERRRRRKNRRNLRASLALSIIIVLLVMKQPKSAMASWWHLRRALRVAAKAANVGDFAERLSET